MKYLLALKYENTKTMFMRIKYLFINFKKLNKSSRNLVRNSRHAEKNITRFIIIKKCLYLTRTKLKYIKITINFLI